MGRPELPWLGLLMLLPLLSAAQQPVPATEQTVNGHVAPSPAPAPASAQTGATQSSVPPAATPAAFEVSTVKLSKADSGNSSSSFNDGRFTATNEPLKNIMEYSAYGIPQPRILGGPKWLDSERFDIQAKMEGAAAERLKALSRDQRRVETQAMFQQLLADRFKLAVHWETRELPVYALVVAKHGPLLHESKNAPGESGTSASTGEFSAKGLTLTEFAEALTQELSSELGRVVIDKTGMEGRYDMALKWTPDTGAGGDGADGSSASADAGPSIFTAIQEQAGLKLVGQGSRIVRPHLPQGVEEDERHILPERGRSFALLAGYMGEARRAWRALPASESCRVKAANMTAVPAGSTMTSKATRT